LMCKVLKVHCSGYYAWLQDPQCQRKKDDAYLLGYVKQFWLESGGVYGYRKITKDMKALGETCGRNRILRLMKGAGISAQRGYKRRASYKAGELSMVAENHLNREFAVSKPNFAWVIDITYIRTQEGWLFLAVVLDLYSRSVIGWSMSERINTDLALGALIMACWRRRDHAGVAIATTMHVQRAFLAY
jgi:putative transposase